MVRYTLGERHPDPARIAAAVADFATTGRSALPERPAFYGDGHAAEKIAAVLAG